MKYYLGLDVGGTNLAAGVVDENCRLVSRAERPSGAGRSIEAITDDMVRTCEEASLATGKKLEDFAYIGIGMPSCVNPATRLLVHANCFGWRNVPIYEYLEKKLPVPVRIENDANCAALGEMLAGAAGGVRNLIMLTLGTGVGSGVIIDGKIFSGADGMGAELGHTKIVYKGRKCTCGQLGCVDAYCSATGLCESAKEKLVFSKDSLIHSYCGGNFAALNARMIFDAEAEGDLLAREILDQYIDLLASTMGDFTAIFRPELFILGGGVSNAGERLLAPLRRKLRVVTFAGQEIGVPGIVQAACGNEAGIIGAAMLGADIQKPADQEEMAS